jgi:tRNA(adenine34) deaminase
MIQARVGRLVFGAGDSRNGACGSVFNVLQSDIINHQTEIKAGVLADDCAALLRIFFRRKRDQSA